MNERFTYSHWSQTITDKTTGKRYYGNCQLCNLLNTLNEEIKPIQEICNKYKIPLKDLPEVLEEYIALDNDDQW